MKLEIASLSDVGQVRKRNEDALGRMEPRSREEQKAKGFIFVVADGMGGHRGGEIASRLAVDTVMSQYYEQGGDILKALDASFQTANSIILEMSTNEAELFGMGTTCTTMVLTRDIAYFAHVGDSRAYVYRASGLMQLTEDHSLVGEMVRSGMITSEDAQHHPKRNVITRSLGTQHELETDFPSSPFTFQDDDVFLLCSDGLTSLVTDSTIEKILSENAPKEACQMLVDAANNNGGHDNVTVQIVKIHRD